MMILVTGATGLVGSALIRKLAAEGKKLRGICRHPERRKDPGFPENVEIIRCDILQPHALQEAMYGVEAVIHLVGILFEVGDHSFEQVHVRGTNNLLEVAQKANVQRFIHVSALGTRSAAKSRYHQTKWLAEESVRRSHLNYTIFQPSVIFGPWDDFSNQFAQIARLSPFVPILGNGQARMQPVWVHDVAHCLAYALNEPAMTGKTLELGGPEILTFREMMDEILLAANLRRIKIPIPFPLLTLNAWLLERFLNHPPVTVDQLIMAREDNICLNDPHWEQYEIRPKGFKEGIREYL